MLARLKLGQQAFLKFYVDLEMFRKQVTFFLIAFSALSGLGAELGSVGQTFNPDLAP